MSPDLLIGLLAWASLLSGLPSPHGPLPAVTVMPQTLMSQGACGKPCPVLGWYHKGPDGTWTIALDQSLHIESDIHARSVLVHELVHYLQQASHGEARSCVAALSRERVAYAVQRLYIERHGEVPRIGLSLHTLQCHDENAP